MPPMPTTAPPATCTAGHHRPTQAGNSVRAIARLLALTGRASKDETAQVLALVANLAALADAVAQLRDAQQQSCPGRGRSRRRRTPRPRASSPRHDARPRPPSTGPPLSPSVHRSPANPGAPGSTRRKVQP